MQFQLPINIDPLPRPIIYTDNILLVGSCFTEHISERLQQHKFRVLQNPHGILFNPLSVAHSLNSYMEEKIYNAEELFPLNELWNSWDHHTRFSHIDKEKALEGINHSQKEAAAFIRKADWVMITLGSAFQYYLTENGQPVANNHRAPAQWFEKRLLSTEIIIAALKETLEKLFVLNEYSHVLFTISPVRHIRDGVIENNRSKARLIEAVHSLCAMFEKAHYFPAYELVIDILRDHRFYDVDLVHPNYPATTFVWEKFTESCISPAAGEVMEQVLEIVTAKNHRARFPETEAHKKFKKSYAEKAKALVGKYPHLDLSNEISYFES